MKKLIGTIGLVMIMGVSLVACGPKDSKNEQNKGNTAIQENSQGGATNLEALNADFAVSLELNAISKVSGLSEMTALTKESADALYNFGKYSELEKEVRSLETEKEVREIALVKVKDASQSADLYVIMLDRLATLKEKYAGNENVSKILNDSENMILKQQDGILIFILAENAKEIEMELDKSFE